MVKAEMFFLKNQLGFLFWNSTIVLNANAAAEAAKTE